VRTNGTLTEEYTYDLNGNRLTGLHGGTTSVGTYDAQDRLSTYGDWTYAYTANGELASKTNATTSEAWNYEYDVMGNLRSVTLPDDRVVSYQHDARNRRIAKSIDGIVVRRWVYGEQLNSVLELDGNSAPLFRYVYASMAHSSDYLIDASGVNYRVLRDQLGSPLLIVNSTNAADVMFDAQYSAFGRRTVTSGASTLPTLGLLVGSMTKTLGSLGLARGIMMRSWEGGRVKIQRDGMANKQISMCTLWNDPANFIDPSGQIGAAGALTGAISGAIGGYISGGLSGAVVGGVAGGLVGLVNPWSSYAVGAAAGAATASLVGQLVGNRLAGKPASNISYCAIGGAAAGAGLFWSVGAMGPGIIVGEGGGAAFGGLLGETAVAVGEGLSVGLGEGAGATVGW
jgi:YD repeat-containing protein